jgi:uncharacterized protein
MDTLFIFCFFIALFGGIISVPIGGSFMFVIPAFLLLGFDGASTLLLARMFMMTAMTSGNGYFFFKTNFDTKKVLRFVLGNLGGYILAAQVAASLDIEILTKIVPWMLVVGGIVLLKDFSLENFKHQKILFQLLPVFGFVLGFYGGLGGGGNGPLIVLLFSFAFGWAMNRALVNTKLVELFGNTIAVISYLFTGFALTGYELPVLLGGAIGGVIGAHLTLKSKPSWLKYAFLAIALISAIWVTFFK